jgi:hypothetical protein
MVRKQRNASSRSKPHGSRGSQTQAGLLRRALEWFLKDCSFTDLRLHRNVGWQACELVALGVLWSWSDRSTLGGAFEHASEYIGRAQLTMCLRKVLRRLAQGHALNYR